MTSRDWHFEMNRLRSEACENDSHDVGDGVPPYARMVCAQCIEAALTAAYEAGRADAAASHPPPGCYCVPPLFPGAPACTCCHAAAGEPCRHEVKP